MTLITEQYFRSSRYADVAEQVDNIGVIIQQAESAIEGQLGRKLAKATYVETHRPTGPRIYLRQRPIVEIDKIEHRINHHATWAEWDVDGFEVEPDGAAGVLLDLHDNMRGREVRVTYEAGFDPIPDDLKAAVVLRTVLLAFVDMAVYSASDGKEPDIKHIQAEADRLLAPYKKTRLF